MATLIDGSPAYQTVSFPIVKMEETPDGDLLIYGKATDGSVDSDDQIVDAEWSGKALQTWLKTGGNVRVQHSPNLYPAGNGVEVDVDKDGSHWVKSLIVEDTAKNLVRKGVLRAYSVGIARPRIVRDASARGGRIVDGQIAELSLVDRPANKNCGFTLCKSDTSGHAQVINKAFGPTDIADDETVEKFRFRHGWIPVGGGDSGGDDGIMHSTTGNDYALEDYKARLDDPKITPADRKMIEGMIQAHLEAKAIHEGGGPGASSGDTTASTSTDPRLEDVRNAARRVDRERRLPGTKGPTVTTTKEELVTATVTFTPKDLAMILGKSAKPKSVGDDADPTDDGGGPRAEDDMSDKKDTGGGKETATSSKPMKKDLDDEDKGNLGKGAVPPQFQKDGGVDDPDADDDDELEGSPADDASVHGDNDMNAGKDTGSGSGGAKKIDAGPFAEKRDFSEEQRTEAADSGAAMPDGSFPIKNKGDLHNAIHLAGHGKDPAAARAHIKRRASALGLSGEIPDTWKVLDADVAKVAKVPCPGCGKKMKPSAKFCAKCGGKMAEADVEKGMGRSPAEGVRAKTTEGLPDHREPDGAQTAEIEHDAGLKTDGDGPGTGVPGSDWDGAPPSRPSNSAGTSLKFDGPEEMKRLHDLTCAAFSAKSLNEAYPHLPSLGHAIDPAYWRNEALKSVSNGDLTDATGALVRAQAADVLKGGEVDVITEAQADLHKSFTDMYPSVSEPTPTELDPGRYTRPYLTAGHARETLAPHGSQPPKPRAHDVEAQDFQRGPLTGGHARNSPASKGSNAGAPGGMSAGVYYGNAARNQAVNAMISLHDHVAGVWPALCPMTPGNPSRVVGKSEEDVTPEETVDPWYGQNGNVTKAVTTTTTNGSGSNAMLPDLVKAALAEVLVERDQQIKVLQDQIDEMSKMSDPREASYRGPGSVLNKSMTAPGGTEMESRSVIQKAAKQRDEAMFGYLQERQTYAPTPAEREQARVALQQMMNHNNNAG